MRVSAVYQKINCYWLIPKLFDKNQEQIKREILFSKIPLLN